MELSNRQGSLERITLFNLVFCLGVILWGAFVRATGSGAGCGSHWPLCNGAVVPRSADMEMLIEYSHRLSSGLFMLTILFAVFLSFKYFPKSHLYRRAGMASLFFVLVEAAIGAAVVLLELVADNSTLARTVWVGAHLVNTFILVAVLTYQWWLAKIEGVNYRYGLILLRKSIAGRTGKVFSAGLLLTLIVASTGAVVALGDTLFPPASISEGVRQHLDPTSHFLVKLRIYHPTIAVAASVFLLWFAKRVSKESRNEKVVSLAKSLTFLVCLQIGIGFTNLALLVPVWTQMLHLLFANIMWIVLVLTGLEFAKERVLKIEKSA